VNEAVLGATPVDLPISRARQSRRAKGLQNLFTRCESGARVHACKAEKALRLLGKEERLSAILSAGSMRSVA
jgi:hypothetical protein